METFDLLAESVSSYFELVYHRGEIATCRYIVKLWSIEEESCG